MKICVNSVAEAAASRVRRFAPLVMALAAMAGVWFFFSGFIDSVQNWAVASGLGAQLLP